MIHAFFRSTNKKYTIRDDVEKENVIIYLNYVKTFENRRVDNKSRISRAI